MTVREGDPYQASDRMVATTANTIVELLRCVVYFLFCGVSQRTDRPEYFDWLLPLIKHVTKSKAVF